MLDFWPIFPLIILGQVSSRSGADNIMAALEHSDIIGLYILGSRLTVGLKRVREPFLEDRCAIYITKTTFVLHVRLTLLQVLLPGTFHLAQWSTALSTLTSFETLWLTFYLPRWFRVLVRAKPYTYRRHPQDRCDPGNRTQYSRTV